MLNSEIQDVMSTQGRTPTLYNDAAVKVLTYDTNQWVAFDDAETLELKVDFAKDKWLVSGEPYGSRYLSCSSLALAVSWSGLYPTIHKMLATPAHWLA